MRLWSYLARGFWGVGERPAIHPQFQPRFVRIDQMKQMLVVAGLLALAACGKTEAAMPAADSTAAAPAMMDSMSAMPHDSMMPRDTSKAM